MQLLDNYIMGCIMTTYIISKIMISVIQAFSIIFSIFSAINIGAQPKANSQAETNSIELISEPTPTIAISASPTQLQPSPTSNPLETMTPAQVVSIVDGDTIKVSLNDKTESIRIIGIDTPETVDPRSPVQCFGREASNKMKELVSGKTVYLEGDPSQDDRDKYKRLLRFVFLSDGNDVGLSMIKDGFAHEYTYDKPYKYQAAYVAAQREARDNHRGLWSDVCQITVAPTIAPKAFTAPLVPSKATQKVVAPIPVAESGGSWACNCSKTCAQMSSCAEAQYQLNNCGCSKRDGDDDGIACDSDCQ
jgi:micrococcal nuclease